MTTPLVSFREATAVVAEREIMIKLRSKAFLISTGIVLLVVVAAVVLGANGSKIFGGTTKVVTVSQVADKIPSVEDTEVQVVDSAEDARQAVRDKKADVAVLPDSGPSGVLLVSDREAPSEITQALSIQPKVELLDPNAPNPGLTNFIGLAFGLVFFMAALTFGQGIAQSVVEEKQTRIVEILLAAVPARAMLAGKVIGSSILAFGQIVLIGAAVLITGVVTGATVVVSGLTAPILWFVLLFVIGFVMISSLYAAAASLVSRTEDLPSVSGPVMIMIPYFLVISFANNPDALGVMSYVPFSAPVAVPMRVFLGTAAAWEPVLSALIMLVTTVLIIVFAARVYSRQLLRTGQAVKWKDALKRA